MAKSETKVETIKTVMLTMSEAEARVALALIDEAYRSLDISAVVHRAFPLITQPTRADYRAVQKALHAALR